MGEKYVQEEFLGEECLGDKYMGEKYVQEEFLGEESLSEKHLGEKYVQEEFLGEESQGEKYVQEECLGEKSLGENRGRWEAGFRSPLLRYVSICFSPYHHAPFHGRAVAVESMDVLGAR